MARWSDIAEWVGPTPNQSGPMQEYRGLVIHIMQGSYDGSIAWGKNPASSVSFHFATRADGHIGQLVDTGVTAWTQAAGNGHWISVENEGYSGNPLTPQQVEAVAQIYARGVREYDWPLQITDSPSGYGLGWHGMGGAAWGGHPDCPGQPIKDQRPAILARAAQILGGGDDMDAAEHNSLVATDNRVRSALIEGKDVYDDTPGYGPGQPAWIVGAIKSLQAAVGRIEAKLAAGGGAPGSGPVDLSDNSLAAVRTIVDQELDEQSLGGADKD